MQININRTNFVNGYATRDITILNVDEYSEIILCLKIRLETLEEKLEEYQQSDDERMKGFIPKTESEINRLKILIETLK